MHATTLFGLRSATGPSQDRGETGTYHTFMTYPIEIP